MGHLKARYAGVAEVVLEYLDGKSMQEQAAIYNAATIVIWNHGAAMANLIYAPVNSVGLQVCRRLLARVTPTPPMFVHQGGLHAHAQGALCMARGARA